VITSVTRDDLPDGGAAHFAATVREIKQFMPAVRVEVLIPDFQGDSLALRTVLDSNPDVLNHNIETVPRLYPLVRPQAGYQRSLDVLKQSACFTPEVTVKSGLMVGLGEREDEITAVLHDLHAHGCSVVTIGQYLQPSQAQIAVDRFVSPEQFDRYETIGRDMGFQAVFSGPFVRSSYMAAHVFENRNTKFTKLPI
jgi:lipoic acid synthetase